MALNFTKNKKFKFLAVVGVCVVIGFFTYCRVARADTSEMLTLIFGTPLNILAGFLSAVLGIVGSALDWVLSATALKLVKDNEVINIGWTVVRDLVNMFFILILLVVAFAKVLGISKYRENIVIIRLVVAALLINFSKVICGFFIDVSNLLTMFFVKGVQGGSIGENLANALKIQNLFSSGLSVGAFGSVQSGKISTTSVMITLIFVNVMLAVAAVVFLMLTIMLLVRMVYLWVLVMLSPAAWFGWILSGNLNFGDWWNKFWKNIVIAPAAAFYIYLATQIVSTDLASKMQANMPGNIMWSSFSNNLNMILQYGIVVALLVLAYSSAKAGGGMVASWAGKGFEKGKDKALGFAKRLPMEGIKAMGRAAPGGKTAFELAKKIPVAGGIPRALARKQQADVKKQKEALKNFPIDDLEFELSQMPVGEAGMRKRAAILELLAEKGKLDDKHKGFVKRMGAYGGNIGSVFSARPDWIPELKEYGKGDETIQKTIQGIPQSKISSLSTDSLKNNDVKKAIKYSLISGKWGSGHLSNLAKSDNKKLAEELKNMIKSMPPLEVDSLDPAMKKYLSSPGGQSFVGVNIPDELQEGRRR